MPKKHAGHDMMRERVPSIPATAVVLQRSRRELPRGVSTLIEKSTDLQDWRPCHADDLEILSVGKTAGWGVEIVTARLRDDSAAQAPARYLRLRVMIDD